jgi:hypothetical protein
MKTSAHLIIYISENEDFELWKVLSQMPSEERVAFIKSALKHALAQSDDLSSAFYGEKKYSIPFRKGISVQSQAEEKVFDEIAASDEKTIKPFKLGTDNGTKPENPEHNTVNNNQDEDGLDGIQIDELFQSTELDQDGVPPGLNFLLTEVIGQEDDETVIEFLKKNMTATDR